MSVKSKEVTKSEEQQAKLFFSQEDFKQKMAMVLPKYLTADRMVRVLMGCVRETPTLLECTQLSLTDAIMRSAQFGLEPGSHFGHCFLIPYKNYKTGILEAKFVIGYAGLIERASRAGFYITVNPVYVMDIFEIEYGDNAHLRHVPCYVKDGKPVHDRGEMVGIYTYLHDKNGNIICKIMMSTSEIQQAIKNLPTSGNSVWKQNPLAMMKKTVILRLKHFIPSTNPELAELKNAMGAEDFIEGELAENNNEAVSAEIIGSKQINTPSKADSLMDSLVDISG